MIFTAPTWVEQPPSIPETMLVGDFVMGRHKNIYQCSDDKPSITCAVSGRSYGMDEVRARVDLLSRSLGQELQWSSQHGSPRDKVVAIFSFNTIDFMIASWAIHQIGGICLLLHPTCSASEIKDHLTLTRCHTMFTCPSLLVTAEKGLDQPNSKIYLLEIPGEDFVEAAETNRIKTISQLIALGKAITPLKDVQLRSGESRDRVAFLCPTSGTSGKQKLAQLTHYNVMANCIQAATHENPFKRGRTEISLGILPLSHSYALILGHLTAWRGDCLVVHPRFNIQTMLASISQYRIERLYLVPSIIGALIKNPFLFEVYDVSTVETVVTGSAALGPQMAEALEKIQPKWLIQPGYGLTESGVIISFAVPQHTYHGSDGCLLPMVEARLVQDDGIEVEEYGESGELLLRAPTIMKGYFGDETANAMAFDQKGWLRTGDVAIFKRDAEGHAHLFIVDRKKDIMKVKGMQVAPVEIEAHLLSNAAVTEAAVISVPEEDAGERPFAFIVRSDKVMTDLNDQDLKKDINKHVESTLSEPHWLRNNIAIVKEIPKSHNGKALKFMLRESVPSIIAQ